MEEKDDPPCACIHEESRRIVMMTLGQIGKLGKELTRFLALFVGCFRSRPGFALVRIYVQGLLSDLGRKNAEAIALEFDTPPRTLQRFVESIKWDERTVSQCIRNVRIFMTLEMSACFSLSRIFHLFRFRRTFPPRMIRGWAPRALFATLFLASGRIGLRRSATRAPVGRLCARGRCRR